MGTVFFVCIITVMIFMFGWSIRSFGKNTKSIMLLLVLSLAIPLTIGQLGRQTALHSNAAENIKISGMEVVPFSTTSVIVNLNTSKPATVYLEYKKDENSQMIPVLPTYTLAARTNHSILVNTDGVKGGVIYININGDRYTLDNKPIQIP